MKRHVGEQESPQDGQQSLTAAEWISRFQEPCKFKALSALQQRFVYSLRLIAIHRKAGRDPLAELTARLGSVTVAVKAIQLVEELAKAWPDPVQVRRCCCQNLSHDELTMAAVIDGASRAQREVAEEQLAGLVRSERIDEIWDAAVEFVAAEYAQ